MMTVGMKQVHYFDLNPGDIYVNTYGDEEYIGFLVVAKQLVEDDRISITWFHIFGMVKHNFKLFTVLYEKETPITNGAEIWRTCDDDGQLQ